MVYQVEDIEANILAMPKADDDGATFGVATFNGADFNATNGVSNSYNISYGIADTRITLDTTELNKLALSSLTTGQINQIAVQHGTAAASKFL